MNNPKFFVGIDGSEWGNRAAKKAIQLASISGARVKLVYVLDWAGLHPIVVNPVDIPQVDAEAEKRKIEQEVFAPLVDEAHNHGVEISVEVLIGEPVHELRNAVKEGHANMLFVGRRGRSRIADLILGSVANKLAHCVGIPVVLVP
mgnify:CR=1 FL=1